jgi:hypothetical protein
LEPYCTLTLTSGYVLYCHLLYEPLKQQVSTASRGGNFTPPPSFSVKLHGRYTVMPCGVYEKSSVNNVRSHTKNLTFVTFTKDAYYLFHGLRLLAETLLSRILINFFAE